VNDFSLHCCTFRTELIDGATLAHFQSTMIR
jgi:hypothetical protein